MIIKEEQNTMDWLIKRRSQIRATDFASLYFDIIYPSTRGRTPAIEKLIADKVYGETESSFNSDYADQGHARESAILARLSAYLGVVLQQDMTAYYDDNHYLASSLDGYAIDINEIAEFILSTKKLEDYALESEINVEAKTMTINTAKFHANLIKNCKKWRYQVMHQIYCSAVQNSYIGIEFQYYFGIGKGFCVDKKDFIAVDFMTGEIIISDFQHWKHEEDLIKATIKEYLFFDKDCTKDVWLSVCNEALSALDDARSKTEL
jgi:hypothetical protein